MPSPGQKSKVKDPVQQKLRDDKRKWNTGYKNFSQRLKAFKNALNGKGDMKMGLPPSDIKNPLPREVVNALGQLAGEFDALVREAEGIVSEQSAYAQNRKKKQPKPAQSAMQNVAPTESPVNPLARIGYSQTLLRKEAFIVPFVAGLGAALITTKLWSLFTRDQQSRFRHDLRRSAMDLNDAILDLENAILSLDRNSIPNSMRKYQSARYNFDALMGMYNYLVQSVNKAVKNDTGEEPPASSEQPPAQSQQSSSLPVPLDEPVSNDAHVEMITKALHVLSSLPGASLKDVMVLNSMLEAYKSEKDPKVKDLLFDRISDSYEGLINSSMPVIENAFGAGAGTSPNDLVEAYDDYMAGNAQPNEEEPAQEAPQPEAREAAPQKKEKAPQKEKINLPKEGSASDELVKTAHNILTRFLKRQLMKAAPFNKTVASRLEVVRLIEQCKKELNTVIFSLKQELNLEEVGKNLKVVDGHFGEMAKVLGVLGIGHKRDVYNAPDKKNKGDDYDNTLTNQVIKNRIRRDLSKGLL